MDDPRASLDFARAFPEGLSRKGHAGEGEAGKTKDTVILSVSADALAKFEIIIKSLIEMVLPSIMGFPFPIRDELKIGIKPIFHLNATGVGAP